jgi:hypothetical protein
MLLEAVDCCPLRRNMWEHLAKRHNRVIILMHLLVFMKNVHTLLDETPILISIWINLIKLINLFIYVILPSDLELLHTDTDMDIRHARCTEGILSAVRCKTETFN